MPSLAVHNSIFRSIEISPSFLQLSHVLKNLCMIKDDFSELIVALFNFFKHPHVFCKDLVCLIELTSKMMCDGEPAPIRAKLRLKSKHVNAEGNSLRELTKTQ